MCSSDLAKNGPNPARSSATGRLLHQPARGLGDGLHLGGKAAEGVENGPVGHGIDEGAVVVLAMDLDQGRADGLQHLDAHGLVVDEGAGAAVGVAVLVAHGHRHEVHLLAERHGLGPLVEQGADLLGRQVAAGRFERMAEEGWQE